MRSVRLTATGLLCAAGALTATITPAVAATSSPAVTGCHIRLYFNQNTYVRTRPAQDATHLGLAYANDTFAYKNQSQNGFLYGTDARATGKTGWVPAANIDSQKVCDV